MTRRPPRSQRLREELAFRATEWFLDDVRPQEIANRLSEIAGDKVTRQDVYPMLRDAVEFGYLLLSPPVHRSLQNALEKLPNKGSVRVVNVPRTDSTSEHLAAAAAELVLDLIRDIGGERATVPVHVGLGIGGMSMRFSRHLAALMRADRASQRLVVHALTPAGSVSAPLENPISSFSYFHDAVDDVEFVGLFAEPIVPCERYDAEVMTNPIVRRSFEQKDKIDIVITSLADGTHEHGSLRQYLEEWNLPFDRSDEWAGDVQLRPYSAKGPILLEHGGKPVTLFELPELVAMAEKRNKYVVLVCGPCGKCRHSKAEALYPLLTQASLRLWTHLVVDRDTGSEVLDLVAGRAGTQT
jgi:hypothetical protein